MLAEPLIKRLVAHAKRCNENASEDAKHAPLAKDVQAKLEDIRKGTALPTDLTTKEPGAAKDVQFAPFVETAKNLQSVRESIAQMPARADSRHAPLITECKRVLVETDSILAAALTKCSHTLYNSICEHIDVDDVGEEEDEVDDPAGGAGSKNFADTFLDNGMLNQIRNAAGFITSMYSCHLKGLKMPLTMNIAQSMMSFYKAWLGMYDAGNSSTEWEPLANYREIVLNFDKGGEKAQELLGDGWHTKWPLFKRDFENKLKRLTPKALKATAATLPAKVTEFMKQSLPREHALQCNSKEVFEWKLAVSSALQIVKAIDPFSVLLGQLIEM